MDSLNETIEYIHMRKSDYDNTRNENQELRQKVFELKNDIYFLKEVISNQNRIIDYFRNKTIELEEESDSDSDSD